MLSSISLVASGTRHKAKHQADGNTTVYQGKAEGVEAENQAETKEPKEHEAKHLDGDEAKNQAETKGPKEHKPKHREEDEDKSEGTGDNFAGFHQAKTKATGSDLECTGDKLHQAEDRFNTNRSEDTGDSDFQTKAEEGSKGTGDKFQQAEDKFDTKAHQDKTRDKTKAKTRTETGGSMSLRGETGPRAGGKGGELGSTHV